MNNHQKLDYLDTLQQAATLFIQRHEGQHLGNDQILFSRTVSHLMDAFSCNQATAENVTARAYGDVRSGGDPRYMDVARSTRTLAMLVDPQTGMWHAVPVSLIFQQIIDSPARRRLRSVN